MLRVQQESGTAGHRVQVRVRLLQRTSAAREPRVFVRPQAEWEGEAEEVDREGVQR